MKLMDKAKQAALAAAVKTGLGYLERDPEVNIPKLMELVDKFVPDGWYESQRNAIRNAIQDKDSNWYKLILRIYELDPGVREAFFTNFIINASLKGSALQEETAEENNCNVPWAILLDPTSDRVYKKAYSHEKTIEMILNGECGMFNPLLLECLVEIQDKVRKELGIKDVNECLEYLEERNR